MCEAHAYLLKNGQEEKVFENVDRLQFEEGGLLLEDIFGRRLLLNARIKELALVDHKIILEEIDSE
ncbi:MAG: CooT family nickel-binding protein [Syntrophaceticus sp.]|nr:CooT family nickel-binding protein [Syntrophaceticus sp.]MDD4360438.1 CooT family nickel-binding protein [Syntrophaceticus sp.]MDD4783951.1 CooT family nickel-binding protein [Syntrophaceticus sp.]